MENAELKGLWFDNEGIETTTSVEQVLEHCEHMCSQFFAPFCSYSKKNLEDFYKGGLINEDQEIRILRSAHSSYLADNLANLPGGFITLDSSRPWIMYWIIHALYLLEKEPTHLYSSCISTLQHLQQPTGGFAGGSDQLAHGAPNYAAVLSLCTIGTKQALSIVNRPAMYSFFMSLKDPSGGFRIHKDGEVDSRGTYTIVSVARLLNLLTPELTEGVAEFVLRCQTYEGGFGGEPFNEAHGGYNFCAVATLLILGQANKMDIAAQERWLVRRQMRLEGGFQGRTNKLVDACYSYWQGAAAAMIEMIRNGYDDLHDARVFEELSRHKEMTVEHHLKSPALPEGGGDIANVDSTAVDSDYGEMEDEDVSAVRIAAAENLEGELLFNQKALQSYILHCGQNLDGGGLRDKPGKSRDFYHSCYALSGLSIAQSSLIGNPDVYHDDIPPFQVYGAVDNLLRPTSAVYNIGLDRLLEAIRFWSLDENGNVSVPSHQELLAAFNEPK